MVRLTKNPARYTYAQVRTLVQTFLNSDPQIGPLEEQVQRAPTGGLRGEDKERLIEKLDQVCHPDSRSFFPTAFSHRVYPGVYDRQRTKHEILDPIWKLP